MSLHLPTRSRPPQRAGISLAVSADDLTVMEPGRLLLPPTGLRIATGTAALIVGGTPISRLVLAHALTGRLPTERVRLRGQLEVFGATSSADIRARSLLALPWRARTRPTAVARRLAALEWATDRAVGVRRPNLLLVVLSPGLEGLRPQEVAQVVAATTKLNDLGPTVLLTGPDPEPAARRRKTSGDPAVAQQPAKPPIGGTITVTALSS
ncbi:MAG: hypothetical protein QG671_1752 [Actinomycetota bacterium]|nr:hypothetical protein [Actinomycetota bacterium]